MWFAVYQETDGELVSVGTVIADPLRRGLATTPLAGPIESPRTVWNTATLEFDPAPPPPPRIDRVEEYLAALPPNQRKQEARLELQKLLGPFRFRDAAEARDLR